MRAWHPSTLTNPEAHYQATPWDGTLYAKNYDKFVRLFNDDVVDWRIKRMKLIFLRGYFYQMMPGYFSEPYKRFAREGFKVEYAPILSGGDVRANGAILDAYLSDQRSDFVLLCHSKSGLDFLASLVLGKWVTQWSRRLRGVVFCQTPLGPSVVMDQMLRLIPDRRHVRNALMRYFMQLAGHTPAGLNLSTPGFESVRQIYDEAKIPAPLLSVATWSIKDSSRVDSFHGRLTDVYPGRAHDGQFFLDHQLWPNRGQQLVLGGIDHAQPVMGGLGFDCGRFWVALLSMLASEVFV